MWLQELIKTTLIHFSQSLVPLGGGQYHSFTHLKRTMTYLKDHGQVAKESRSDNVEGSKLVSYNYSNANRINSTIDLINANNVTYISIFTFVIL